MSAANNSHHHQAQREDPSVQMLAAGFQDVGFMRKLKSCVCFLYGFSCNGKMNVKFISES